MRGREPRTITWDDEAGTVAGDHYEVAYIRERFEAPKPVTIGGPWRLWDLVDPAHDPINPGFPRWIASLMTFLGGSAIRINAIPSSRRVKPVSPCG